MCRTTNYYHHENRFLRLKTISLRLSLSTAVSLLPGCLSMVFLPRINGTSLEVNGSKVRCDSPVFLSLRRTLHSNVVFSSEESVRVCDGVVFEVLVAGNSLLRGVFRRCDDGVLGIECKFVSNREFGCVSEVEVLIGAENGVFMSEKVVAKRRSMGRFRRKLEVTLEDIPEETECDVAEEEVEESGAASCCSCSEPSEEESGSVGGKEYDHQKIEMDMESVRWAVDVGIWIVSFGLGYLVSRASTRNLRRLNKFVV